MKILAIRGRNLASLEGDFEIDFTAVSYTHLTLPTNSLV